MPTTIYRDSEANAIFIQDANGAQFLNSLHATTENSLVSIEDTAKSFELVTIVGRLRPVRGSMGLFSCHFFKIRIPSQNVN